jgi:hypothetical protein
LTRPRLTCWRSEIPTGKVDRVTRIEKAEHSPFNPSDRPISNLKVAERSDELCDDLQPLAERDLGRGFRKICDDVQQTMRRFTTEKISMILGVDSKALIAFLKTL